MTAQDLPIQTQDLQNKVSHFEQSVKNRFGEDVIEKGKKLAEEIDPEELKAIGEQSLALSNKIVAAIESNLTPDSAEVQELMEVHYALTTKFQVMSKEEYLNSREFLRDAPEFYAVLHPKLPDFLYEAMGIYADKKL